MSIRNKIPLMLFAGALAIPAVHSQGPATDAGQGAPETAPAPAPRRYMGSGGQDGGRYRADGWGGRDGGKRWGRGDGFRGMRGRRGRMGGMMLARIAQDPEAREKLGLTAEQTTKIQQETFDFRKARIRDRADTQLKQVELENLMRADNPDRAAIDKKLDELSAARLVAEKSQVHYRLAMREVLTPEQREKLRTMFQERGRRLGFQDGPRPGGQRGPRGPRPQAPSSEE